MKMHACRELESQNENELSFSPTHTPHARRHRMLYTASGFNQKSFCLFFLSPPPDFDCVRRKQKKVFLSHSGGANELNEFVSSSMSQKCFYSLGKNKKREHEKSQLSIFFFPFCTPKSIRVRNNFQFIKQHSFSIHPYASYESNHMLQSSDFVGKCTQCSSRQKHNEIVIDFQPF